MRAKSPAKPHLTVAASGGAEVSSGNTPPRPLGQHGVALWQAITSSYGIDDEGGRQLLAQTCEAVDRVESLRAEIDRDGQLISTRTGVRDHPLLRHELSGRAFITRSLARLGVLDEPIKSIGRPPGYR